MAGCQIRLSPIVLATLTWIWMGHPKFKMSRDVTTPFQGRFVVHMLELATTDLCTKFEISKLTHYKDMKGDKKCKNVGGFDG